MARKRRKKRETKTKKPKVKKAAPRPTKKSKAKPKTLTHKGPKAKAAPKKPRKKRKPRKMRLNKTPKFKLPVGAVKGGGSGTVYTAPIIREMMQKRLTISKNVLSSEQARQALEIPHPLDVSIRTTQLLSGSVDGELVIQQVPRGLSIETLLRNMTSSFYELPESFLSIGIRYAGPEGITSSDYRYKGQDYSYGNYIRIGARRKITYGFMTAYQVYRRTEDKGRNKPNQIIVRYHWNPENVAPTRRGRERKKGRRQAR